MRKSTDFFKDSLERDVGVLFDSRLEAAEGAVAKELLAAYMAGLSDADLDGSDPQLIYGAVASLLALARDRAPGRTLLRVYDPDPERDGWMSRHSVIEIVNDDMPFLVDSVTAHLAARGVAIHLLVHPVLGVERDGEDRVRGIGPMGTMGRAESWMHIEIDRQDAETRAAIARELEAVLADARAAVGDWPAMREALRAAAAALPPSLAGEEDVGEVLSFLDWLHDDNFTFLGHRSFLLNGAEDCEPHAQAPGLGVLRDPGVHAFDDTLALADMPADLRAFLRRRDPLLVTKSVRYATVHRRALMDVVAVKRFDAATGAVCGLAVFVGLFTAAAYTMVPSTVPFMRRKVERVLARAGFPPASHDAKALANVLETYPRDELIQLSDAALFANAVGILRLLGRPRVALFARRDPFERLVSCLIFVPRDRYDSPLRLTIQNLLETAFSGHLLAWSTQVGDHALARLHMVVRTTPGATPDVDLHGLEARIAEVSRSWADHVQAALVQTRGEAAGLLLARRYAPAFPASYRERHAVLAALADIERLEQIADGGELAVALTRPVETAPHRARIKLYRRADEVVLSDVLPMLEAMGLKVIAETPHAIVPSDGTQAVWIHDFDVESPDRSPIDLEGRRQDFEETLIRVWRGEAENDGFNRLVLAAGLTWRQVTVLRAYAKFLRQAGSAASQAAMESALAAHPAVAAALVALFEIRFDPARFSVATEATAREFVAATLAAVEGAEDDRLLRRFLGLIGATLRTTYFQRGAAGALKPTLAFKLDSHAIEDLPQPRPLVEIWIYSPRVEAAHLRGGRVARGGIRWSDRREDFRTEILGLMKAQMVKNAVIVPVGAKGGFFVKRPPAEGGRPAILAEGVACYRLMIEAMLDLTDTIGPDGIVPPPDTLRHDGDDPYLVVAADKGTATFSDIANAIAQEHGFWLGDAFASGGSHGYDHKAIGITARGAWEAVKRHFREMGTDCQTHPVSVVGVGDMSGDVFGNGMLQSRTLRLIGAFNHAHVFIDPDPDPERAYAERERLFQAAKSWPDYDPAAISPGGGVFSRAAKRIPVSPEMRDRFGLAVETIAPDDLIRALLTLPVDLLFFGGIGTYVRAHDESDAEAGDRANDALRVEARALRARVVGEGANLAMTQRGRVEYAMAGGRLNTDAIDNSAGVDCSDHEVNIKILLDRVVANGDMTLKQRNALLVDMTDEVARLVLRDNVLQTQALSLMEARGGELLDAGARFIRLLEKSGRLDRANEFLPDEETLARRAAARAGFPRPELAVLLAYAKTWLYDAVLHSDLPDEPGMDADLIGYFPEPIQARFAPEIARHRLRREIVATAATNSMINRVGIAFVADMLEKTGLDPADIARAYIVARESFELREIWRAIEALDGRVLASVQLEMLAEGNRLLERVTHWVLRTVPHPIDIAGAVAGLKEGVAALEDALATGLADILPDDLAATVTERAARSVAAGVPDPLARRLGRFIPLTVAPDIVRVATLHRMPVVEAARLYFACGQHFGLSRLHAAAQRLSARGHWEKLAIAATIEDLYARQRDIARAVAGHAPDLAPAAALESWIAAHPVAVERALSLLAEIDAAGPVDLAMLTVASRELRSLSDSLAMPS
jgi:glutamate dehydrogenase